MELYRLLALGISLWNQFAVPALFSVFWFVLLAVQLGSDVMSSSTFATYQGIMFFLLTRYVYSWIFAFTLLSFFCVCIFSWIYSHFVVCLLNHAACQNVAPRRTLCWASPSWCPIWLWDFSTCASFTWEVTLRCRTRTSCTGETLSTDFLIVVAFCSHQATVWIIWNVTNAGPCVKW